MRSPSGHRHAAEVALRLLYLGVLGIGACGREGQQSRASFEMQDSAGVPVVQSRTGSWDSAQVWRVSTSPSLQLGAGDDEAQLFFQIRQVRLRSDGGVVVLEGSSAEIRVFDPSGRAAAVFAGDGDGPGELRGPREMYVLPGDTVMVFDSRPSRTVFDPAGDFVHRETIAVNRIRAYLRDRLTVGYRGLVDGSVLAVGYAAPREQVGRVRNFMLFTHASIDGARLDTLSVGLDREWWVPTGGGGRGRTLLGPMAHWAAGGAPVRIALGESGAPSVHVYAEGESLQFVARFPDGDRSVPSAVLDSAREDRRDVPMPSANLERFLAEAPDPQMVPAFGGLLFDQMGYLWVLPYYPDEGASAWSRIPTARVLNHQGHLMGMVELPAGFRLHDVSSGLVAGVRVGDFDVELVEVYELSRGAGTPATLPDPARE